MSKKDKILLVVLCCLCIVMGVIGIVIHEKFKNKSLEQIKCEIINDGKWERNDFDSAWECLTPTYNNGKKVYLMQD